MNIPTPQKPIRKSGPLKRTTTSKSSFGLLPVLSNCASQCNHDKVLLKKKSSTKCSSKVTSKSSNCGPPSPFLIWHYLNKQPVPPHKRQSTPSPSHNDSPYPAHSSPTKAQTTYSQPEILDPVTPVPSSKATLHLPSLHLNHPYSYLHWKSNCPLPHPGFHQTTCGPNVLLTRWTLTSMQ